MKYILYYRYSCFPFLVLYLLLTIVLRTANAQQEDTCVDDSSCEAVLYVCQNGQCVHKNLFPLGQREIIGSLIILLFIGFAQAGGIGQNSYFGKILFTISGGGIATFILISFFNYEAKKAIQITFLIMFFGSLGNFRGNSQLKTQYNQPIIHYALATLTIPVMMSATIFGVMINHFVPDSLIIVGIVVLVSNNLRSLIDKFKQLLQKENEQRLLEENQAAEAPMQDIVLQNISTTAEKPKKTILTKQQKRCAYYEKKECDPYPRDQLKRLIGAVLVFITLSVVRGGRGLASPFGIAECTAAYYLIDFIILGTALFYYQKLSQKMKREQKEKEKIGFNFEHHAPRLDDQMVNRNALLALYAGFMGGAVGIGGGLVMTPLWMSKGLPSMRASATSTFMVVFTSFSSFFTNIVAGNYQFAEFVFWAIIAFVGSESICRFLAYIVAKFRRESILLGVLLVTICLSVSLLLITGVIKMINDPERITRFGQFC